MSELLSKNIFNEEEINNSKRIFSEYSGSVANNNLLFREGYKAVYDKDYSFLSLKRSRLLKCQCNAANFEASALTGSDFQNTDFLNCKLSNATLDYCTFFKCNFYDEENNYPIIGANLGNSSFISCKLDNISIDKSTVSNVLFEHCTFNKCSINFSSFENTMFYNCVIKKMEFRNLNLEFVEFSNCKFENVILSFAQVPYTFGLLNYIKDCSDSVWITSAGNRKKISVKEYFEQLPGIIPYYISEQEYFPVANIYIALGEYERAFNAVQAGIQKASLEKNFRMLKYLCKLSVISGWCKRQRLIQLYNTINDINRFEPLSEYQRHNYFLHLGDFRKILLFNDNDKTTLHFNMQTNILPEETEKVALLIGSIDKIINSVEDPNIINTIELRHESPYEFLILVIGAAYLLKIIAQGLHYICTSAKDLQEIILNCQQIKMNNQEISMNQAKIAKMNHASEETKDSLAGQNISINGNFYFTNYQSK